ncbi:hypothetical protein EPN18_02925 [bacterium]|nr:MAG: hypothetical protein EPN18_02925 [bacterium]
MNGNRGASTFKAAVWIFIIGSLIYGASKTFLPVFSYYMVKLDAKNESKMAHMYNDATMKKRILEKARSWSIPLNEEDVVISRGNEEITVEVQYTQVISLDFVDGYDWVIPVDIIATSPIRENSDVLR